MMTEMDVYAMWAKKAENDLKAAKALIEKNDPAFYDTACFLAQQCAEKYIKGFMARNGIPFKKSHDLGELLELIPESKRPKIDLAEADGLSNYAVLPRYPGFGEELNREDVVEALRVAEKVKSAVLEKLR